MPVIIEGIEELVFGIVEAVAAMSGAVTVTQPRPVRQNIEQRHEVRDRTPEDGRHVVKVSDAIQCCEAFINSPVFGNLVVSFIEGFFTADGGIAGTDQFLDEAMHKLAECIRKHALKQTNPKHARKQKGVTRKRQGRVALGGSS